MDAAKHEVARAKLDKEYSEVKAEITGRISSARLTEGNLVNAGGSDPLLTTIVGIDPIRVVFNIDEALAVPLRQDARRRRQGSR